MLINSDEKDPRPLPSYKAIRQMGTINQFHSFWNNLITQYGTASAICGYTSIAAACIIAEISEEAYLNRTSISIDAALSDEMAMLRGVEQSMSFILKDRSQYISDNQSSFSDKNAIYYKKAWVANYEISDFVRSLDPNIAKHIIFVRFNQITEIGAASFEEKIRLEEEKPYGAYIVETFADANGHRNRHLYDSRSG